MINRGFLRNDEHVPPTHAHMHTHMHVHTHIYFTGKFVHFFCFKHTGAVEYCFRSMVGDVSIFFITLFSGISVYVDNLLMSGLKHEEVMCDMVCMCLSLSWEHSLCFQKLMTEVACLQI
jgi:hypothetical protein